MEVGQLDRKYFPLLMQINYFFQVEPSKRQVPYFGFLHFALDLPFDYYFALRSIAIRIETHCFLVAFD